MNTTTLHAHAAVRGPASHKPGAATRALRAAARDFVMGLLSVTKSGLLLQQAGKPRLRRF